MIKKRKIVYIIGMILFELFQQTYNVNAAGITETQPSGTINVSLEEYQELLRYRWEVANYETLHPNAVNLEQANATLEKAYAERDAIAAERDAALAGIKEQERKAALCWQAGASYIYAPGDQGFALEAGVGYKNIMPTIGIKWQAESGFGYSLGVRYVH